MNNRAAGISHIGAIDYDILSLATEEWEVELKSSASKKLKTKKACKSKNMLDYALPFICKKSI